MILEGVMAWQLIFIQRVVNDVKYCAEIYHNFPGALCIVEIGNIETFFVSGNPVIISLLVATGYTALILAVSWAGYKSLKLLERIVRSRGKKDEMRFLSGYERDGIPGG